MKKRFILHFTVKNINAPENKDKILEIVKQTLLFCCSNKEDQALVEQAFREAILLGERMPVIYKEKQNKNNKAVVFLYYRDSGKYAPELRVYNESGEEILKKQLPESSALFLIGEIRLSETKVAVYPRRNSYTKNRAPISFDLPLCTP